MIMKVQVHAIHFSADRKLLDSIQAKLNKLETFYDRITGGEVFLKSLPPMRRSRSPQAAIEFLTAIHAKSGSEPSKA